jgi:protein tyrosine phosphatase
MLSSPFTALELKIDTSQSYQVSILYTIYTCRIIKNKQAIDDIFKYEKKLFLDESSRVKLPMRNDDPLSMYINANYIAGYKDARSYVASQGPMSNTLGDFWCMIWQERVSNIVMITKLKERNKSKCEMYMPDECSKPLVYDGEYIVTVKHVNYMQDYEARQLVVQVNFKKKTNKNAYFKRKKFYLAILIKA